MEIQSEQLNTDERYFFTFEKVLSNVLPRLIQVIGLVIFRQISYQTLHSGEYCPPCPLQRANRPPGTQRDKILLLHQSQDKIF